MNRATLVITGVLVAGCGGTMDLCYPPCPTGFHCDNATGCVPDKPGGLFEEPDFAGTPPPPDLAMDLSTDECTRGCPRERPYCSPERKCVLCVEDNHCPLGQVCKKLGVSAICVPGCASDDRCTAPSRCCDGICTDVSRDAQNCGKCGNVCVANHSSAFCVAGMCIPGACAAGWGDCNKVANDGCETNLRTSVTDCSACGATCSLLNAKAGCANSCYIVACNFGYEDCNAKPLDGCEASLMTDAKNCGKCKVACAIGKVCMNGQCS